MARELNQYEFINSQTGNVIAYLSLPNDMNEKDRTEKLEKQKGIIATFNKLHIKLIYWQDQDHRIR